MTNNTIYSNYKINKALATPLYFQLKRILLLMIEKNNLQPGDMIPKELELCHIFQVSRTTVRQSINELVNEGYFFRVKGHGTFVSFPKIAISYDHHPTNILGKIIEQHPALSFTKTFQDIVNPPYEVQHKLDLSEKHKLVCIKEIIRWKNFNLGLSTTYFSDTLLIEKAEKLLSVNNLKMFFSKDLTTNIIKTERNFFADSSTTEDMTALEITRSTPIQVINSTSYNKLGQPIVYNTLRYRADMTSFIF